MKVKSQILDHIKQFISNSHKKFTANQYFSDHTIDVYIRIGHRYILKNKCVTSLEIGRVTVFRRGRGIFSQWFLPGLISINPYDILYVECVLDNRFREFFRRNGWTEVDCGDVDDGEPYPSSFYLLSKKEEPS
jgi:hypothetical protein